MCLSTHYYVLSLRRDRSELFEAFRDDLIEVQNMGFPVLPRAQDHRGRAARARGGASLELVRSVDRCFGRYYRQDALRVVLVGEGDLRAEFLSVTTHADAVVGEVEGDYSTSDPRHLSAIAWAVVKAAMSGATQRALRELEACTPGPRLASGLDAVARRAEAGDSGTLLVEEDYHLRGHFEVVGESIEITGVDVRDAIDDVIDAVIEKLLRRGGSVVFSPVGSLRAYDRIVLLSNES